MPSETRPACARSRPGAIEADARAALRVAEPVVTGARAVGRGAGGQLRIACAESMTVGLLARPCCESGAVGTGGPLGTDRTVQCGRPSPGK